MGTSRRLIWPGRSAVVLAAAMVRPFARAVAVRVIGELRNARAPDALTFNVMPPRAICTRDWRRLVVTRTRGAGGGGSSERKFGDERPVSGPAIVASGAAVPVLAGAYSLKELPARLATNTSPERSRSSPTGVPSPGDAPARTLSGAAEPLAAAAKVSTRDAAESATTTLPDGSRFRP